MKNIIIFGTGKIADVVYQVVKRMNDVEVVAFTVDEAFMDVKEFNGVPVYGFEDIVANFSTEKYHFFVALGYHNLNALRKAKVEEVKRKGYSFISIIDNAICDSVKVGENCFIMPPSEIHPCSTIGDNVFIWSGAVVGHHSNIQDDVWVTSGANISGNVTLGKQTFVAIGATVGHNVKVGEKCFLGANCLVTKDTKDEEVFIQPSTKPFRLNSRQFVKMTGFN